MYGMTVFVSLVYQTKRNNMLHKTETFIKHEQLVELAKRKAANCPKGCQIRLTAEVKSLWVIKMSTGKAYVGYLVEDGEAELLYNDPKVPTFEYWTNDRSKFLGVLQEIL